jgi:2-polyprenyl-3-methyl-5-hydroxy-6-metoxy-1,4-benzoquinol methylase
MPNQNLDQASTQSANGDSLVGKLRKVFKSGQAKTPIALTKEVNRLTQEVTELRQHIFELQGASRFDPPYTSADFTERFRGSRADVVTSMRSVVPVFAGAHRPILDLGCGNGEMLEALRDANLRAYGFETDQVSVDACVAAGFDVRSGDGVAHLGACARNSLGGVAVIQVIEHLSLQQRVDTITHAFAALEPGGVLAIETVNPLTLYTFANALYLDPTHTQPIHPLYLRFVLEHAGFTDVTHEVRSQAPADEQLPASLFGPNADPADILRLNHHLFGYQDYLVTGRKPKP